MTIRNANLSEADVRTLVRLLGDVVAFRGSIADRKRLLMDSVCELVAGKAWVWTLIADMTPGRLPLYVGFQYGGFSEESFSQYLKIQQHPDMAWLTEPFAREIQTCTQSVTRTLEQIVPEATLDATGAGKMWREIDMKPRLLCAVPVGEGGRSAIAIYRSHRSEPFTMREARIVNIIMTEIPWLHAIGWPGEEVDSVPSLSPRERLILELLLQSHSRKWIAAELEISINTVAGYVKQIYRTLNVRSHTELMTRFYQGNRGEVADRHP